MNMGEDQAVHSQTKATGTRKSAAGRRTGIQTGGSLAICLSDSHGRAYASDGWLIGKAKMCWCGSCNAFLDRPAEHDLHYWDETFVDASFSPGKKDTRD